MIIVVSLGILAGTVTLVLASVVLRAGRGRPDSRLFAAMATLAGAVVIAMAVDKASMESVLPLLGTGRFGVLVESHE